MARTPKPSRSKVIVARLERLQARREKVTKLRRALGKRQEIETGFGPVGVSSGRGGQPNITARARDFGETRKLKGRYDELFHADYRNTRQLEEVLAKPRKSIKVTPAKSIAKPAIRDRKKALLRGIVLRAENSPQRFLGADKIARAAVRLAEKKWGHRVYEKVFKGDNPLFAQAKRANMYKEFLKGADNLTTDQEDVLDNLSQSSADDVADLRALDDLLV